MSNKEMLLISELHWNRMSFSGGGFSFGGTAAPNVAAPTTGTNEIFIKTNSISISNEIFIYFLAPSMGLTAPSGNFPLSNLILWYVRKLKHLF